MNVYLKASMIGALPALAVATAANYVATDNQIEGRPGIGQPATEVVSGGAAMVALGTAILRRSLTAPTAVGLAAAAGGIVAGTNAGIYGRALSD